jgi:cytochrome c-type biogenesis protein CcmF
VGLCTMVGWRSWNVKALLGRAAAPAIGAAIACSAAFALWKSSREWDGRAWLSVICIALAGLVITAVTRELVGLVRKVADDRAVAKSRRSRMGAHLVHLAVAALFVGFSGSAHTEERSMSLGTGQTMRVGDYEIKLAGLREDNDFERHALLADLEVKRSDISLGTLSPARHTYHSHPDKPTSEVVIRTDLTEDLFLILGSGDPAEGWAVIRAVVNPLVVWIWIGGALLVIGALVAVFPSGWIGALFPSQRYEKLKLVKAASAVALVAAIGLTAGFAGDLTVAIAALAGVCLALMMLLLSKALADVAAEMEKR